MNRIQDPAAPEPIGPYSPALTFGPFVQVSGQIPLDATGCLVQGEIEAQTRQVMDNLKALLEAGGARLDQVVKCTCYLADLSDFPAFNEVYGSYFASPYPCRATVQAALPQGARVEVEALAYLGD